MQTLEVRSVDGVGSRLFVDDGPSEETPLLWLQPAMGVDARWYRPLASAAAVAGLRLVRADLRGHGSSEVRASARVDFGYRDIVEFDLPAQLEAIRARFPKAPVILGGHSLGGQLALLFGARRPGEVEGVVTIAAASVFFEAWRGGSVPPAALWLATQGMGLLARGLGWFPGQLVGFGGREARDVMRDWARQARTGRYKSKGLDYDVDLLRCRTNALFISIEGDWLAPAAAVDDLARRIPTRRARRVHLELPDLARPHFDWVRTAEAIMEAISTWRRAPSDFNRRPLSQAELQTS